MKNEATKKNLSILISLIIFLIFFFLMRMLSNNNETEYDEYLKNYEVNEYIPTYVSD